MLKTKTNLNDLLEKYKDMDPQYVNNRLKEYDELAQYYTILHTKHQMEDSKTKLYEWWELAETQLKEEMRIILVVHKKDGDKYIQHMSNFKKAFPTFYT
jgi:hypothetical protein